MLELLGLECQKIVRGRGGAGNPAGSSAGAAVLLTAGSSLQPRCVVSMLRGLMYKTGFTRSYVMASSERELRIVRAYV